MANRAQRGTKRTCQSGTCGSRFYDLNRNPILCPICGATFVATASPAPAGAADAGPRRPARKPEFVPAEASPELPEAATDDALIEVEGTDEPIAAGEDEETFLEQEEDEGGDVSGIIGGAPEGEEEA